MGVGHGGTRTPPAGAVAAHAGQAVATSWSAVADHALSGGHDRWMRLWGTAADAAAVGGAGGVGGAHG